MTIGKRIMELRAKKGWTQGELAAASKTSQRAVSAYENEDRTPNVKTISKLSAAFGMTFNEFIEGVDL